LLSQWNSMKQRGRKSASHLAVLRGPRLVASQPADDPPPPPAHLGEREQAIWNAVAADWKGTAASFIVLTTALEAHQRAREARQIIDDEGMVVTGRDGQSKAHPLCSVERDARAAFQRTIKQLGIKL
jgi:P27 family predicted phage terminase small subunit